MRDLRKSSLDTLTSNLVVQMVGIISFFLLPNILALEDYALVVYWGLISYYAGFADLGVLRVYGRKAPAFLASEDQAGLIAIEQSVRTFLQISITLYSIVVSSFVYYKTHSLFVALIVFPLLASTALVSFYLQTITVRGGFSRYKVITIFQSIVRLACVLGAYVWAFSGYLAGLMAGLIATFFYIRDPKSLAIDLRITARPALKLVPEGMVLAAATMIWGTLLMLGRFYAALELPAQEVAMYGVLNSGYQIITSMVVAICLPVTIRIYSMTVGDKHELLWFVTRIQVMMVVAVTIIAITISCLSPYFLPVVFKKYSFNGTLVSLVVMSAAWVPIFATTGSVLIGRGRAKSYLALLATVFAASYAFLKLLGSSIGIFGPALTQLVFLAITGLTLIVMLWGFFTRRTLKSIIALAFPLWAMALVTAGYACLYVIFVMLSGSVTGPLAATATFLSAGLALLVFWWRDPWVDSRLRALYSRCITVSDCL
ncbi:MAG: hypothetical protein PHV33_11765 [Elusimicrobiales bacterium]|nr:hypothetical protein [Elusimicrobiales bacterium]